MKQLFYKDLPVVVTGGCGFIGSHMVQALVELGAHVTILDNLSTGSLANIVGYKERVTFIHGSITDKELCTQITQDAALIFHLAAIVSVPQSIDDPLVCHTTNVTGTLNMLEAARVNAVPSFIFSSSAAIYGNHEGICDETLMPNPTSPYGYSKLVGELLCQNYSQTFNLNTVILRYFNVYGERQAHTTGVVAHLTHCLRNNLPITLHGNGDQTRDFVSVHDIVEANLMLRIHASHLRGQAFNIATGNSISLLKLLEQLKKKYPHYSAPITIGPERGGDIKHSSANTAKYKSFLQQIGA